MVAVIIGIILGMGTLVWIWKGLVSKTIHSLKESGSSTFEAYLILILISIVTVTTICLFIRIL